MIVGFNLMAKKNNKVAEKEGDDKNLDNDLENCMQELQEWKSRFVRVSADLENFRRRVEKERIDWMRVAQAEVLQDLLSVVDDFDRALQEGEKSDSDIASFLEGFSLISKSLYKLLEKYGVTEITEHKTFDPNLHEAIAQVDSPDHQSGEIVQVMQKGFMLKDKVLRPAKVTVAK